MGLPTGTVTFLFTDIEGSTRRWEQHPEAMEPALARHNAIVEEAVGAHGGHVFKAVGDAFCCVFAEPGDAVAADAGLLDVDRDAIGIGGTGRGADTALVIKPAYTTNFFDLKVREVICMPRT